MEQQQVAAFDESEVIWRAAPGPQTRFMECPAYEVLYGGAAGGGKSECLITYPLRWVHDPHFNALILRRTFPELEKSIIERTRRLYPQVVPGCKYNGQQRAWTFPSGAHIYFGYLSRDADVLQYQGVEFSLVEFDELTHFTEKQYTYLLSRIRTSKAGLPNRILAATNPGGPGAEWVMDRWAPWLLPADELAKREETRARPGEVRYYKNSPDGPVWVPRGTPGALSRTFIPAKVTDNPHLMAADPNYVERLKGLDALTRAQLLDGDWLARSAPGIYFKRAWFDTVEVAPVSARRIRYWDRAATADGGDWTVGVKMARTADSLFYVEDVVRFRGAPKEVEDTIRATAQLDGVDCMVGIEQDPGQAGRFEADYYVRALAGFDVRCFPVTRDKVTRARPASAQAEARNIKLVRGRWNGPFVQELEEFPDEDAHDDQVDALSGAFSALVHGYVGSEAKWSTPMDGNDEVDANQAALDARIREIAGG